MKNITSEVIADSINIAGDRLVTMVMRYPRFVHAEHTRHRAFSFCAASSRAIPSTKFLEDVRTNPAEPVFWGANQSGMSSVAELDDVVEQQDFLADGFGDLMDETPLTRREYAKRAWRHLGKLTADYVTEHFVRVKLHKQIANRVLEPWMTMTVLVSGTEWGNFFALRCHKDAQPEIQAAADTALRAYCHSTPRLLQPGEWHIPFRDGWFDNLDLPIEQKIQIGCARAARVSYNNFDGKKDAAEDVGLYEKLVAGTNGVRHLSPTEHVAYALATSERVGNFTGFFQHRYQIPGQCMSVDPHSLLEARIAAGSKYAKGEA